LRWGRSRFNASRPGRPTTSPRNRIRYDMGYLATSVTRVSRMTVTFI
jgi:hypothetical protein